MFKVSLRGVGDICRRVKFAGGVSGDIRWGIFFKGSLNFRRHSSRVVSKLTSQMYPDVKRDKKFKRLSSEDVEYFNSVLSSNGVLDAEKGEDLSLYNEDWMRKYRGESRIVLRPYNTEQVSRILRYCNEQCLAVVPQGGNTGLVGGSVPVFDEVVLSLSNLNKIREFDEVSGVFKCDAGVNLHNADSYLKDRGYIFPLDLGAKGSSHVGGLVATNAGGLRVLRYGPLSGNVLGLEVVLPSGEVVSSMHSPRKDNTGYKLTQLFIGSEGTLGVITGVSIMCPFRCTASNVSFLGLESYEAVQKLFIKAKKELCEILSAFEFIDKTSYSLTSQHLKGVNRPLEDEYAFYVLVETSGSNKEHDDAKLEAFLESAMEEGLVVNAVLVHDENGFHNLWRWREAIPEASASGGGVYKYDVSLPLRDLYSLVEAVDGVLNEKKLIGLEDPTKPAIASMGYGHLGDGNLHLNIAVREYNKKVEAALEPFVYQFVASKKGSISAEHGLGFQKKNYILYSKSELELRMMKELRQNYDPIGILNPYKLF